MKQILQASTTRLSVCFQPSGHACSHLSMHMRVYLSPPALAEAGGSPNGTLVLLSMMIATLHDLTKTLYTKSIAILVVEYIIYIYVYRYMYVYTHIHIHTCIYVFMYIYIYIYVYVKASPASRRSPPTPRCCTRAPGAVGLRRNWDTHIRLSYVGM